MKKKLISILLITLVALFPMNKVLANTTIGELQANVEEKIQQLQKYNLEEISELDPNDYITLPSLVFTGTEYTINISDEVESYQLYYQFVDVDEATFDQMDQVLQERNSYVETANEELQTLEDELTKMQDELKALSEEIETLTGEDPDSEQLPILQQEYEEKYAIFESKYEEYETKYTETTTKAQEYDNQYNRLAPQYNDNDWIESTDNKFTFEMENSFANILWVRLVTQDATYYDMRLYSVENEDEDNTEDNNSDNNEDTPNNNVTDNEEDEDPTTSDKILPFAGKGSFVLIGIALMAIVSIVTYIKVRKWKGIK